MKIFISYRSLDREAVRAIVDDLEDIGHEIWTEGINDAAQSWWDNILDGIRQTDLFIFGLTENWFESETCLREFDYATSLGKNRLPVSFAGYDQPESIPQQVRRLQIVSYDPESSESFRELQRAINRMPLPNPAPDPLPEPPASPMEPLAQYEQQLRSLELQRDAQTAMVFELKRALRQQQSAEHARMLLQNLKKHPDTGDTIASRIDRALSETQGTEPERLTEDILPILPDAKP
ncbi:MAG: toll/interleukin-1 receptor domain-containing protein, partial [Chloroflexota bacterium]